MLTFKRHSNAISVFLIVYSILQMTYVIFWSIFGGVAAIFISLISGMAHGKVQQQNADSFVLFILVCLLISIPFALYSTPFLYKSGKAISIDSEVLSKQFGKISVILIASIIINGTTFFASALYLTVEQLNRE
jgi:hypothetical protein